MGSVHKDRRWYEAAMGADILRGILRVMFASQEANLRRNITFSIS
jgi:hypothetical protein